MGPVAQPGNIGTHAFAACLLSLPHILMLLCLPPFPLCVLPILQLLVQVLGRGWVSGDGLGPICAAYVILMCDAARASIM
jgi:hypothetical protein